MERRESLWPGAILLRCGAVGTGRAEGWGPEAAVGVPASVMEGVEGASGGAGRRDRRGDGWGGV